MIRSGIAGSAWGGTDNYYRQNIELATGLRNHFDAEELSNLFYDDRDYDIQHMAKKYFQQDYDYHYDYDCYDFKSYYFDMIDKVNVDWMREKYFEGFDGDRDEVYNKEGFMEFVEEEFGNEIGCADLFNDYMVNQSQTDDNDIDGDIGDLEIDIDGDGGPEHFDVIKKGENLSVGSMKKLKGWDLSDY